MKSGLKINTKDDNPLFRLVIVPAIMIASAIACGSNASSPPARYQPSANEPVQERKTPVEEVSNVDAGENQITVADRQTGTVSWFDREKGYGFITPDQGGEELFVHYSAIQGEEFKTLSAGQTVEFTVDQDERGPAALDVTVLESPVAAESAAVESVSTERETGVVKWFNSDKGYGFIVPDSGGADLRVHYSEIRGEGFRTLSEGQRVEFTLSQTSMGPAAVDVVVLDDPESKTNEGPRQTGTVQWFNEKKGYGFIMPDKGGADLFVHFSALRGDGYLTLSEGERVEFTVVETNKGPTAFDVVPLK